MARSRSGDTGLHRPRLNGQHAVRIEHTRRPLAKIVRAHLAALHGQHANPALRQASAAILVYDLDRPSNILEDGHRSTLLLFSIMLSCGHAVMRSIRPYR